MSTSEKPLPSLESLQRKIDRVKGDKSEPRAQNPHDELSKAMRLSIDLVAGVGVCVTAGYLADRWLGTMPWCMIGGVFLGMIVGVRNMMRSSEAMDKETEEENEHE